MNSFLEKNKRLIIKFFPYLYGKYRQLKIPKSEVDFRKFLVAKMFLQKGDTAIDAGAHLGTYTEKYAYLVKEEGLVLSFEANPYIYDLSSRIFSKRANIRLFNFAVSNTSAQKVDFFVPPKSLAENATMIKRNTHHFLDAQKLMKKIQVETIKLDDYISMVKNKVSLIKFDVEGNEDNAIKGAFNIIQTYQPAIIMEYSFQKDKYEPQMLFHLKEHGYLFIDLQSLRQINELPYDVIQKTSFSMTDILAYPERLKEKVDLMVKVFKAFPS
jgi:FkbM family methyltransferase